MLDFLREDRNVVLVFPSLHIGGELSKIVSRFKHAVLALLEAVLTQRGRDVVQEECAKGKRGKRE
jgi:hypothetical protein